MKKKILILTLLLLIPYVKANALTGSVSVNCNKKELLVGESTSCTLSGYSNEQVSAISMKLSESGTIDISNIVTSNIWQGNGFDGNIQLYTDSNKINNFAIATFNVKGNSVGIGKVSVSNVAFTDEEFNEVSMESKNISINVVKKEEPKPVPKPNPKPDSKPDSKPEVSKKSSDNSLKSLIISSGNIDFKTNVYEYRVDISSNINEVIIKATANDSKAKIDMKDKISLNPGENNYEITVIAEDGSIRKYKIIFNKHENKLDNNSNLKEITIDGENIKLEKDKYIYDVGEVKTDKLDIKAFAESDKASLKIYGQNKVGVNDIIMIDVIAEDGNISNYIFKISNNYSKNKYMLPLIIVSVISGLLIVINVLTILYFRQKK